jgi:AraC-like DNA-binding protein
VISIRTTEYCRATAAHRVFESNMFSRTNAFALLDEQGRIKVETAEMRPGGVKVSRVRSTGHFVDLAEETAVTLLFPTAGQLRVRVAAAEYRIGPRAACIFSPSARRTRAEPPADAGVFQAHALMIPQQSLQGLLQAARNRDGRCAGLSDGMPLAARRPEVRRLSDLLGYITQRFDDGLPLSAKAGEAMAVLLEEALSDVIHRVTDGMHEERTLPATRLRVRLAEEFMRARSDEPLSMAEVAREVGVGLRSLQLAFHEVRAMGPRDVLLHMRLERARARLKGAGPLDTVTSIALECGFAHLGRFPAAYRTAFGELPTETLARRRRPLC